MLAWTADGAWERFAGPVDAAHAADPRGRPRRLPPLLRHVPRVADVRGAGHERARAHGQLRRRRVRAARSTGCTWPARATCAARTSASSRRCATSTSATRASSSGSCCRSTASPACAGATRRRRGSSTTSAWRCTAASAASPAATARRRCASTASRRAARLTRMETQRMGPRPADGIVAVASRTRRRGVGPGAARRARQRPLPRDAPGLSARRPRTRAATFAR